jgi:death on curing protein
MFYPQIQNCIEIHNKIIEISGGREGILNEGYLQSVLDLACNDEYYPEFLDKLTHICFGINKNHAFMDGNKRSSIAISELFLKQNGYDYVLPIFATIMEDIAVGVADNIISKEDLKEMLLNILEGYEMSEEQKLLIYRSQNTKTNFGEQ